MQRKAFLFNPTYVNCDLDLLCKRHNFLVKGNHVSQVWSRYIGLVSMMPTRLFLYLSIVSVAIDIWPWPRLSCQWSRSQSTNIKSIGNILSWTICEPIWSVLFLLCSHDYFHIYSLWSVNWPRKSLGYKVMMCRTDKLIHGTNTTYPLCNLLHGNIDLASNAI